MTPADLARLHARAFTTPRPWTGPEFAALLSDPPVVLLTEAAGFLLARVAAGEAELLTLAVDPDARRQGTGARLVRAFLDTARARQATEAFLEVAADNAAAIALYDRAGFVAAGRRPRYYAPPEGPRIDALVMRARLTPRPLPDF
jgi:ribosomal-protein-alanine N-acetyltransferase